MLSGVFEGLIDSLRLGFRIEIGPAPPLPFNICVSCSATSRCLITSAGMGVGHDRHPIAAACRAYVHIHKTAKANYAQAQ